MNHGASGGFLLALLSVTVVEDRSEGELVDVGIGSTGTPTVLSSGISRPFGIYRRRTANRQCREKSSSVG
jgi:hypothetical protein